MARSRTDAPVKAFDAVKAGATEAFMEPPTRAKGRNPRPGEKMVRLSSYIREDMDTALRDEALRLSQAERRLVKLNEVVCAIFDEWKARKEGAP
jgi:hypothetical protein